MVQAKPESASLPPKTGSPFFAGFNAESHSLEADLKTWHKQRGILNAESPETASNFTIVTAFFDIGRGEWKHFRRSVRRYMKWSRLLLAMDLPLFEFVTPGLQDTIWKYRKEREHRTVVVVG